jgi:hypothetical protein
LPAVAAGAGAKLALVDTRQVGKALCWCDLRANSGLTRALQGQVGADKSSNQQGGGE